MLSLTRKADYALVALAELARRGPGRVSARKIAQGVRVPLPVLTNILHQLLHQGLVTSSRGAQGGYCLSRKADEINLAEVIDAIGGPVRLTMCCSTAGPVEDDVCDLSNTCRIKGPVQRVHQGLRRFLEQVTLAHIAFDSVPINVGLPVDASCGNRETASAL